MMMPWVTRRRKRMPGTEQRMKRMRVIRQPVGIIQRAKKSGACGRSGKDVAGQGAGAAGAAGAEAAGAVEVPVVPVLDEAGCSS